MKRNCSELVYDHGVICRAMIRLRAAAAALEAAGVPVNIQQFEAAASAKLATIALALGSTQNELAREVINLRLIHGHKINTIAQMASTSTTNVSRILIAAGLRTQRPRGACRICGEAAEMGGGVCASCGLSLSRARQKIEEAL